MISAHGPSDNVVYYFFKKFSSSFIQDTIKQVSSNGDPGLWANIDKSDNITKLTRNY